MLKRIQCKNCSSNDLKKINSREYECNHCHSIFHVEGKYAEALDEISRKERTFLRKSIPALFILIAAVLLLLYFRGEKNSGDDLADEKETAPSEIGVPEKTNKLNLKIDNLHVFSTGLSEKKFTCIYHNTSTEIADSPQVEIQLFDKEGNFLKSETGYAEKDYLMPGESVPMLIRFDKIFPYDTFKAVVHSKKPYFSPHERPNLEIKHGNIKKAEFTGENIKGYVKNLSSKPAGSVEIIVYFFDKDKRVIGIETAYADQNVIEPGDESSFTVTYYSLLGKPDHFQVDYEARFKTD